jgi:hypothetical protein
VTTLEEILEAFERKHGGARRVRVLTVALSFKKISRDSDSAEPAIWSVRPAH